MRKYILTGFIYKIWFLVQPLNRVVIHKIYSCQCVQSWIEQNARSFELYEQSVISIIFPFLEDTLYNTTSPTFCSISRIYARPHCSCTHASRIEYTFWTYKKAISHLVLLSEDCYSIKVKKKTRSLFGKTWWKTTSQCSRYRLYNIIFTN